MFLRRRFYLLLLAVALIAGLGYAYDPLFTVGRLLTLALFLATIADIALLWHRRAITAERLLRSSTSSPSSSSSAATPLTSHFSPLTSHLTPPSVPLVVASIPSATSSSTLPPVSASSSAVTAVPPPATSASIPRSSVCTSTS